MNHLVQSVNMPTITNSKSIKKIGLNGINIVALSDF